MLNKTQKKEKEFLFINNKEELNSSCQIFTLLLEQINNNEVKIQDSLILIPKLLLKDYGRFQQTSKDYFQQVERLKKFKFNAEKIENNQLEINFSSEVSK